ncbi:hypothetical protein [Amycolatopsis alba]|uniref:hypothetical protein n=1 Tax=Amycolatopsis alba TaxID=76020 RepID=UPI0003649539|nr:hypothetical protein [Amycolatopsis alba]
MTLLGVARRRCPFALPELPIPVLTVMAPTLGRGAPTGSCSDHRQLSPDAAG